MERYTHTKDRTMQANDKSYMQVALGLAQNVLGVTWPNPAVGCVLVREGNIIGCGATGRGGIPHAEAAALAGAGLEAQGSTAYVTLEPCSHHGKTPPCAKALRDAGISRLVAALEDPDPRVAGQGLEMLKAAGIAIDVGVEAASARRLLAGYFSRQATGRPLVTVKLATSLDGRIAAPSGNSQWITGKRARERTHELRAHHDAIAIGIETALHDNPRLTCRLPGFTSRPRARIVFDSHLRLRENSILACSAKETPLWLLCSQNAAKTSHADQLRAQGVDIVPLPVNSQGKLDLEAALLTLGKRGLTSLLVEGGACLAGAFLAADRIDRLSWFRAPLIAGHDAWPALTWACPGEPNLWPRFDVEEHQCLGDDDYLMLKRQG